MPRVADPIVAHTVREYLKPRLQKNIKFVDYADSWGDALSLSKGLNRVPISRDWLQTVHDRSLHFGFTTITFAERVRATRDDVIAWRVVALVEVPPRSAGWSWHVEELFVAQTVDGFGLAKSPRLHSACGGAAGARSRRIRNRRFVKNKMHTRNWQFSRSIEVREQSFPDAFTAGIRTQPYEQWLLSSGLKLDHSEMSLKVLGEIVVSHVYLQGHQHIWPFEDQLGFLGQMDWDLSKISSSLTSEEDEAIAALTAVKLDSATISPRP
jgi:hypothetical protein